MKKHLPGSSKWPRLDPEVTSSGLKWPPFGESKGHFEEAGACLGYIRDYTGRVKKTWKTDPY